MVLHSGVPYRLRPHLWFGTHVNSAIPEPLLAGVAVDVLHEFPAGEPLLVQIRVEDDWTFTVEDNGRGLDFQPLDTKGPRSPVQQMLVSTAVGGWRFGMIGVATAWSESLVADTWWQGTHSRQRASWDGLDGPVERMGTTDRRGTALRFELLHDLPEVSTFAIPRDWLGRLEKSMSSYQRLRIVPGTVLTATDGRTGETLRLASW